MKLIREIESKKVLYLLNDGEDVTIGEDFSTIGDMKILDVTSATHELVEGVEPPDIFVGGGALSYDTSWNILNQEVVTAAVKRLADEFVKEVDKEADSVIRAVIGDRATEYLRVEEQAKAFQAAGYTGDVPDLINADVVAKGLTPEEATLNILATASKWHTVQSAIRMNRIIAKANALAATTKLDLDSVKSTWYQSMAAVKQQLGLVQTYPFQDY